MALGPKFCIEINKIKNNNVKSNLFKRMILKHNKIKLYSPLFALVILFGIIDSCNNPSALNSNNLIYSADSVSLWTQQTGSNLGLATTQGFYAEAPINMEMIFTATSNMQNPSDLGNMAFNNVSLSSKGMNGQYDTLYASNADTFNAIYIYINTTTESGWKYIRLKNIKIYKIP